MRKALVLTAIGLLACTPVRGLELSNAELAASAAAAMAAWEGKVMTVTGLIPADQIGITMPHEHLLTVHQGPSIDLVDESLAISELWWYAAAGGKTLIEMSDLGVGRQPLGLKRISEATGVQVVMGAGYYKEGWQTPAVRAMSVDQIAESIVSDIVYGVDGVHAGQIGEIGVGVSTTTDFERNQLQAVAIAQKATGAAISMHFDYEIPLATRVASMDIIEAAGGDMSRVIFGHVVPRLSELDEFAAIMDRGMYVQFDYFGLELINPNIDNVMSNRSDPAQVVKALIDMGYVEKLLLSMDVCDLACLKVNNGPGYDHLIVDILPDFRAAGITEDQIHTMTVENPQRVFQFTNYAVPEPGTLALLVTGLMGLLGYAWRRRGWRYGKMLSGSRPHDENTRRSILPYLALAIMYILAVQPTIASASIIGSGDLDPLDPTTWDSSTTVYVGNTSGGSISVDLESDLSSSHTFIATHSGSTGTATVDGAGSTWTVSGNLLVGQLGSGTLGITNGGAVSDDFGCIGHGLTTGGTGAATVDGPGSTWTNSNSFYVGYSGSGTLDVTGGAAVSDTYGHIGYGSDSTGAATVDGAGSTWTSSSNFYVGNFGNGALSITRGGVVGDAWGYIGYYPRATGAVTVDGAGSTWISSLRLYVGGSGNATLDITDGGLVSNSSGSIGYRSGSTGAATVDGDGSTWTSSRLYVGDSGNATLNVTNGGAVRSSANGYIGYSSGSTGVATVDGDGSTWTNSSGSSFYVGYSGSGTLNITGGGGISGVNGYIGYASGSVGVVTLDGDGSTWTNSTNLNIGTSGKGTLTQSGGTNTVGSALVIAAKSGAVGTYNLNGGTLILSSLSKGPGNATFNFGGGTLKAAGVLSATLPMMLTGVGGNANVDANSYAVTLSGQLSGSGGLNKLGERKLTLSGANSYAGVTAVEGGSIQLNGVTKAQVPVLTGGGADIKAGKLIFDYAGESSPAATIMGLLTASYNAGAWNTGQLKSSTATADRGLGWVDDTATSQVTVAYTSYGDANLDGTTNFTDLSSLLSKYNQTGVWSDGDFNYDGAVNFLDLSKMLSHYNQTVGTLTPSPEPSSIILLLAGGVASLICSASPPKLSVEQNMNS